MKKTVGARELKTRLGSYIQQVRNGACFVVTERGQPVAELRPLEIHSSGEEASMNTLVATGILSRVSPDAHKLFKPIRGKRKGLTQAILEDRKDRLGSGISTPVRLPSDTSLKQKVRKYLSS